jgi:hypothetical protein
MGTIQDGSSFFVSSSRLALSSSSQRSQPDPQIISSGAPTYRPHSMVGIVLGAISEIALARRKRMTSKRFAAAPRPAGVTQGSRRTRERWPRRRRGCGSEGGSSGVGGRWDPIWTRPSRTRRAITESSLASSTVTVNDPSSFSRSVL